MSTDAPSAFASHLARWRAEQPEMQFAEPFLPAALRPRLRAWGTLLAELEHSMFTPADAQVAAQRLAWWHGELRLEQPQHPVARALRDAGAPLGTGAPVAGAAVLLVQDEGSATDVPGMLARFADLGAATAAAEALLFDGGPAPAGTDAIAAGLLGRWLPRLPEHPRIRELLPLQLLARHAKVEGGQANRPLTSDLARELLQHAPAGHQATLYRALQWAFERRRLQRLARGGLPAPGAPVPGPLRATWLAWSTARRFRS